MVEHLGACFLQWAQGPSQSPAIRTADGERSWTRAHYVERVAAAARRLEHLPVGARVLLLVPNNLTFGAWFWACQILGLTAVPLEPPRPGSRMVDQLSRIRLLADKVEAAACVLTGVALTGPVIEALNIQVVNADDLGGQDDLPSPRSSDADALALIQFTSGSTGAPKGCALRHRNVVTNARAALAAARWTPGDTLYNWMPLFHDMGLISGIVSPIVGNGRSVIDSPRGFMLDPSGWLTRLSACGRVHATAPNFALALVLRAIDRGYRPPATLAGIRTLVCGAEPIDPVLVRRFIARLAPFGLDPNAFAACYGMAESTVIISAETRGLRTTKVDPTALVARGRAVAAQGGESRELVSLGAPVGQAQIAIRARNGRTAREGTVGEIHLKSASIMSGYFNDPRASAAVLKNGWLKTGDNGVMIDGDLYFVGRRKDLIIVGGQNIDAHDLELQIAVKTGIESHRICAFNVASPLGDARLGLAVERRGSTAASAEGVEEQLAKACFELTGIRPLLVAATREHLPRTTSGKIRRSAVAERFGAREPLWSAEAGR
jgi:acyl-CoA synthetase (AMP-forming)/AMP-acid ligase II